MERFQSSRTFLENLMKTNTKIRKSSLKNCSDVELQSIIEAIINLNSFPFTKSEQKELKSVKILLIKLIKNRKKDLTFFRSLLIKNQSVLPLAISIVFSKIIEGSYCQLLRQMI